MLVKDILLGLLVVTIWGLNFIAIKLGLQGVQPVFLVVIRFFVASIPALFFLKKPPISWKSLFLLGLSINVGQFSFLFIGMDLGMPAGLASLVLQAQVFFTAIFAVRFLGEKWKLNQKIGLSIAFIGMSIIGFAQDVNMSILGFMFTLCASICWAIGNIVIRKATKGYENYPMLSLIVWAGAISVIPLLLISLLLEGPELILESIASIDLITVGAIIYISYLSTLVGYGLWGKLLSKYNAAKVSPLSLLVPVVGITGSVVFLNESLSVMQTVGGILIMLGLIVNLFADKFCKK